MHVVKFETTTKFIIGGRCIPHPWGIFFYFFSFFFAHFHFPASGQAVVTGVVPSPPRFLPSIFIAHRVQQSHCSSIVHRVLLTHALALSASQFVHKKKSSRIYTSMHSAGLELTKLTYTRLEDNLIRHRGDRLVYSPAAKNEESIISWAEMLKTKCTEGGARTLDHKIKSLALYRLSYSGLSWMLKFCFLLCTTQIVDLHSHRFCGRSDLELTLS